MTPTERGYTIFEKEMYSVLFCIKKFEDVLGEIKYRLMTNHKTLAEIRCKPYFENYRINR